MALYYSANTMIAENNIVSNMFCFFKELYLPQKKKKASFRKNKLKCPNALEQFCCEKLHWFPKHQVRKASTRHIFIELYVKQGRKQSAVPRG